MKYLSKKVIILSVFGIIILAGIEIFTPVNLLYPPFFRNPAYANYPLLKDGDQSDDYEIVFVHDTYATRITYSPTGNFFMVRDNAYLKIDNTGTTVFSLPNDNDSVNPPYSHYIITQDGIYDFSADNIVLEPVVSSLNDSTTHRFKEAYWKETFDALYAESSVVIFGIDFAANGKFPGFFKTKDGWVLMYSSYDHITITKDRATGISINGIPEKHDRLILLKDPTANIYSSSNYPETDRNAEMPEKSFEYAKGYGVRMQSYVKESISENIVFTPIPILLKGTAAYEIKAGENVLHFKETASRMIFSRAESRMTRFILPVQYFDNADISFLEFRPLGSFDTSGSNGLYIIRPRR